MRQVKALVDRAVAVNMSIRHLQVGGMGRAADSVQAVPVDAVLQVLIQADHHALAAVQRAFRLGPAGAQQQVGQVIGGFDGQHQLVFGLIAREFPVDHQVDVGLFPDPRQYIAVGGADAFGGIDHPRGQCQRGWKGEHCAVDGKDRHLVSILRRSGGNSDEKHKWNQHQA